MSRHRSPLLALAAGITLVLGAHPAAQAHGLAAGGALAGLGHPLLGLDHLLMLVAAALTAALVSSGVLLWALGGAVLGALAGSAGLNVPGAEAGAAVAIAAAALVSQLQRRRPQLAGAVVAAGLAIHALLHGLEAPQLSQAPLWWSGALLSSALVCGSAWLLFKRCPKAWAQRTAVGLIALGGLLSLAPLGLSAAG